MYIIAGTPFLPLIAIAITAPTLIALFWSAFRFAATSRQRLANLLVGFVFAVAAICAIVFGFEPQPNSWAEKHYGVFVIGIAPLGAVLGVAVAVVSRRFVAGRTTPPAR